MIQSCTWFADVNERITGENNCDANAIKKLDKLAQNLGEKLEKKKDFHSGHVDLKYFNIKFWPKVNFIPNFTGNIIFPYSHSCLLLQGTVW